MKFEQPTNLGTTGTPLPPNEGGTGTSTVFTKGSVVFAGTSGIYSQDNSNFFYDSTNHRLGIGTTTPSQPLHVIGTASNTNPTVLFEQNASGVGIIQLGNASPSQNAQFIFNFSGDNSLSIKTNYSLGTQNAIAFSPGGTETVRFRQGGLNGFSTTAPTHTITLSSTATTGIAAYNTSDQTTNYERSVSSWISNIYTIGTYIGGTGTARQIQIGTASGAGTAISRYITVNTASSGSGIGQIGVTGGTSGATSGAFDLGISQLSSSTTGTQFGIGVTPVINQSSTAGYRALWISPFEQATGSGSKLLIDAGTNSAGQGAGTHTSKFVVDNTGKTTNYSSVNTTGWGTPAIYGYARPAAGQVGAVTLSTYTVGAADGSFLVSANILVTTATLHSFTVTCTYTDEGNTSRTLTLQLSTIAGAFITAITNAQGTVPYEGVPLHIRAKASTSITIATTGTFTTVVYNGESSITQIA